MAKRNLYSIGPSGPLNSLKCYSTELNLTTDYKRLDESTWKLSVIKENLIELATITLRINDDKTIGTSALYRSDILFRSFWVNEDCLKIVNDRPLELRKEKSPSYIFSANKIRNQNHPYSISAEFIDGKSSFIRPSTYSELHLYDDDLNCELSFILVIAHNFINQIVWSKDLDPIAKKFGLTQHKKGSPNDFIASVPT